MQISNVPKPLHVVDTVVIDVSMEVLLVDEFPPAISQIKPAFGTLNRSVLQRRSGK